MSHVHVTGRKTCDNQEQVSCTHDDRLCLRKILQEGQLDDCPKSIGDEESNVPGLKKWFPIKGEESYPLMSTRNY